MNHIITALFGTLLFAEVAIAGVVEYRNDDRDDWFADVGGPANVSTVDFTGLDEFTEVTDQWAHLGVNFSGDFVNVLGFNDNSFPNDGWGVRVEPDVTVTFDAPVQWVAADFSGKHGFRAVQQ